MTSDHIPSDSLFHQGQPTRRDLLRLCGLASLGLIGSAGLSACGDSSPPNYPNTIAMMRTAITDAMTQTQTRSISIALIDGERIAWAQAFGDMDGRGTAPTTETMYEVGSVSKVLAAVAVMILVDRKLVDLDTPFVQYVPAFRMASPEYTQITVRMLINHSSGLPGTDLRDMSTLKPMPGGSERLLNALSDQRLKHPPGALAVYCNDGFTLIELLVATVSKKSFTDFVHDEILVPLGMKNSRYALTPFDPGTFALGFNGDGTAMPQDYFNAYAAGGLYSTPSDLGRLAMMFMNRGQLDGYRLLSEAAVAEMGRDQTTGRPINPATDHSFHFGLGWDGVTQQGMDRVGVRTWHKNGGTFLFYSDFYVAPDARMAVMVTGNSTSYSPGHLAESLMLRALVERGSVAAMPSPIAFTAPAARTPTAAELDAMVGTYPCYNAVRDVVRQSDDSLTLRMYAGQWTTLASDFQLCADGAFWSRTLSMALRTVVTQGRRYLLQRSMNKSGLYSEEMLVGQKVTSQGLLSAAWSRRIGRRWLATNYDPSNTILVMGASLELTIDTLPELPAHLLVNAPGVENQVVDPSSSDTRALMCLQIPVVNGRDLGDLVIEIHDGQEWVRWNSTLFRPA